MTSIIRWLPLGRELLETEAFLKAAEAGFYSLEL
jgi:hypothetical protein